MRIATFNAQNLRLRRPAGKPRLDGARDGDMPKDSAPQARALDLADRRLTAALIAQAEPDILCLQEVFDRATLDFFHRHLLRATRVAPWPHRFCLPGNDGGGRDLAVLARMPVQVTSHAALVPADLDLPAAPGQRPDRPLFCRDCLRIDLPGLTLFSCHFKAPWPDAEAAWHLRRLEALAVRRLIERHFAGQIDPLWLVLGDLNEPGPPGPDAAIAPLTEAFAVDLVARMPATERWTWALPGGKTPAGSDLLSRPDGLLASPALARRWPNAVPKAYRSGLGRDIAAYAGARFAAVGAHRPRASDHALLAIDLPGLNSPQA